MILAAAEKDIEVFASARGSAPTTDLPPGLLGSLFRQLERNFEQLLELKLGTIAAELDDHRLLLQQANARHAKAILAQPVDVPHVKVSLHDSNKAEWTTKSAREIVYKVNTIGGSRDKVTAAKCQGRILWLYVNTQDEADALVRSFPSIRGKLGLHVKSKIVIPLFYFSVENADKTWTKGDLEDGAALVRQWNKANGCKIHSARRTWGKLVICFDRR